MVAVPLPPGRWQFIDANGAPLEGGTVEHYYPGGLTPAPTWADYGQTIANPNPIALDALGSAVIFADGQRRQIVKDSTGNQIWDENTAVFLNTGADIILTYTGGPPSASQWLGGEQIDRTISFPANFAGSRGVVPKTLPTSSFVVVIQKNGAPVGTATCSTGGTWTFLSTAGAAVTFQDGDELAFYGPGVADATVADFGLTLKGSFS